MIDRIIITYKELSLLSWLIIWFGDKKYISDYDHVSFRDSIRFNKYATWSMGGNSSRAPVVSFCWSLEGCQHPWFYCRDPEVWRIQQLTSCKLKQIKMEGVLFKEFKKRKKHEVVLCAFYCKILEIEVKLTQDSGTGKAEVFERNWSILCFALTHFRQRICSSTFPLPHSAPNNSMII